MSNAAKTAKVLEALVARWPRIAGRDGRSIAEKLTSEYKTRMVKAASGEDAWAVKRELQAIEDLLEDKFSKEFPRQENTNFSGDLGRKWGYSQLSSDAQSEFNKEGFFARMMKRKRPAS
ncbi:hypothetical protein PTSG_05841 [Salpingoeca rosetta]|uniref:Uncharacterized protein n=1 Tax=Salpingoeca rosetta (strain ATCC 50818 / BSB-021) TaxID=946362 RepID=F2UCY2_SALR5|nr:uncharacterized protein PTSG_05841 [Salpingoeca rosetta]EGD74477.1 hypothetical protein PTSG_05841 [Salpingoeca rosetta]|eukprot:XP_004992734.1 hypothetical protein PTSG_05841 [Salpingoeca rosetta]